MVKHNSSTWWCLIGVVWFCFGVSHSFYCGKFEFKDNTGRCRPCRRCSENIGAAYQEGTNVDSCEKSAKPTPKWLGNYVYYCQGITDRLPECKRWSSENGRVSCTSDMLIGTYCKLDCNSDYYSSLNESIKCTGDLEWSKPPPYCVHINDPKTTAPMPECAKLLPSNGYINCTAGRSIGSTCMLSCLEGYRPSTNHPVTCSKHLKWNRQLPICVLDPTTTTPVPSCQPLEVVNGTLYCTEDMFSGSECWVKCNEGFRLEANTTIFCQGDQTWSDAAPSCVEIPKPVPKCKDLTVENGTGSCSKNFDVGSYCNITCSDGMMESSTGTLYCRSNQTWSHSTPYCVSSVPGEVEKLLVSEKFPWYIILIIVVLCILVLTGCFFCIRRILLIRKENVNLEDGTEAHELRPLSPRDSDCSCADQCGNCFICLGCNKDKVKPAELQDSDGLPADKDKGAFNELYPEFENAEKQNSSTERPDQPSASEIQRNNKMYRRDISKNTATAEDLKNVYQDFQAMKKLETLFDQSPRDCEVTWHCLAAHILEKTTDEIKCIEYKHKTDHDNTPTDVVFRLMKERETTLHEVIMYLQKHRELSNVKQALDILYGYCGAWEVAV